MQCVKCKHNLDEQYFSIKENNIKNKVCNFCNEKTLEMYNNRKNNNLCSICGVNRPICNRKNCNKCLNKAKLKEQEKRKIAIAEGLCIACKKIKCVDNSRCEKCRKKYTLPIRTKLFRNAKSRAKKNELDFFINEEDLIIPDVCPILGIKLQENEAYAKFNSYSIDRIDNSKGYIKGNIHIISHRANQIKNDSTLEELEKIISYLKNIKEHS